MNAENTHAHVYKVQGDIEDARTVIMNTDASFLSFADVREAVLSLARGLERMHEDLSGPKDRGQVLAIDNPDIAGNFPEVSDDTFGRVIDERNRLLEACNAIQRKLWPEDTEDIDPTQGCLDLFVEAVLQEVRPGIVEELRIVVEELRIARELHLCADQRILDLQRVVRAQQFKLESIRVALKDSVSGDD